MSLETTLNTLLTAICPRTSPDFAPFDTPRPYVTYQQIGGRAVVPLDSSVPAQQNAEVQINVWADTRLEAKGLIQQIEAALITCTGLTARPLAACVSDYDADIPVYGSRQDFTIWCAR